MFSLGEQFGYIISTVKVLNPIDRFLLLIQPLFPLDFAIFIILVLFVTLAASSGYRWIGIGLPFFKVRLQDTVYINSITKLILNYLGLQGYSMEDSKSIIACSYHQSFHHFIRSRHFFPATAPAVYDVFISALHNLQQFQLIRHSRDNAHSSA